MTIWSANKKLKLGCEISVDSLLYIIISFVIINIVIYYRTRDPPEKDMYSGIFFVRGEVR